MPKSQNKYHKYIFIAIIVIAATALGYGGYQYFLINQELKENSEVLERRILELEDKNILLADNLEKEQRKNEMFGTQIGEIASTVGKLDKLSKTDKELLQKYSKIYFLNEHYVPDGLTNIPPDYLYEKDREKKIHLQVYPYLQDMITAAKNDSANLQIISAYRSFGEQNALKSGYAVTYGSGANKFSADQGYSEHQLGTTVDFTTKELGSNFTAFEKTESYKWLLDNAYRYGFVLSYPENNSYYQFEPWHWRFVGKALASRLHEEKEYFYDLSQDKIDAYLIKIFD